MGNLSDRAAVPGPAGPPGADGIDGKTLRNGTVDPTTEGVDGDFYINTTSNEIFGPKTGGVWGTGTSLVGPSCGGIIDIAGTFILDASHNTYSINHDGLGGFTIPDLGRGFQCVYHNNSNGTVAITLGTGVTNNNAPSLTVLAYGSIGIEFLADGDVWLNGNLEIP
jgi:hypothetical protein